MKNDFLAKVKKHNAHRLKQTRFKDSLDEVLESNDRKETPSELGHQEELSNVSIQEVSNVSIPQQNENALTQTKILETNNFPENKKFSVLGRDVQDSSHDTLNSLECDLLASMRLAFRDENGMRHPVNTLPNPIYNENKKDFSEGLRIEVANANTSRPSSALTARRQRELIDRQEKWLQKSQMKVNQLKEELDLQNLVEIQSKPNTEYAQKSWEKAKMEHQLQVEKQLRLERIREEAKQEQEKLKVQRLKSRVDVQAENLLALQKEVKSLRKRGSSASKTPRKCGEAVFDRLAGSKISNRNSDTTSNIDQDSNSNAIKTARCFESSATWNDALDHLLLENDEQDLSSSLKKSIRIDANHTVNIQSDSGSSRTEGNLTKSRSSKISNKSRDTSPFSSSSPSASASGSNQSSSLKRLQSAKTTSTTKLLDMDSTNPENRKPLTASSSSSSRKVDIDDIKEASTWFREVMKQRLLQRNARTSPASSLASSASPLPEESSWMRSSDWFDLLPSDSSKISSMARNPMNETSLKSSNSIPMMNDSSYNRDNVNNCMDDNSLQFSSESEGDDKASHSITRKLNTTQRKTASSTTMPTVVGFDDDNFPSPLGSKLLPSNPSSPYAASTSVNALSSSGRVLLACNQDWDTSSIPRLSPGPVSVMPPTIDSKATGNSSANTGSSLGFPAFESSTQGNANCRTNTNPSTMSSGFFDSSSTSDKGRHRVNDARFFDTDSIHIIHEDDFEGVSLLVGQRRGSTKQEVVTVLFSRDVYTESQASQWWDQHRHDYD